MTIIRVIKNSEYFTASNVPFNDQKLKWETRGLLAYLLSKPNDWTIRINDLINKGPAKLTKIRAMLKDAQKHGYLNRYRMAKADGTFSWFWQVYESPSMNPKPQTKGKFETVKSEPVAGFPHVEKPVTGKHADVVKTNKQKTESSGGSENIFQLYENNIGALTPIIADHLIDAENTYAASWIADAISIAVKNNKRNWAYCDAILKRWYVHGKDDGNQSGKKKQAQETKTPLEKYAESEAQ